MKVIARLRPTEDTAIVSVLDSCLILDPPSSETHHNKRVRQHKFMLDHILLQDATQDDVYDSTMSPLLADLLNGHNTTIFAYGATGCGKTHTISGTQDDPGLIFRTIQQLFNSLNQSETITELSLSYLEIYNEQIRDLLQPQTPSSKLNLLESNNSIRVANLTKITPVSLDHIFDLIVEASKNRTVSPTMANAISSRSHAILQLNLLQSTNSGLEDEIIQSTLNIIDLAGSERASATQNKGKTLHEGANINKSLLALGSCINALSDSKPHIPYRNSKLTRLLKYSLGGNCQTVMIVCLAPDINHFDDTLNALKYAHMAKNIKNSSVINKDYVKKHIGSYESTILEQRKLIEKLQMNQNNSIQYSIDTLSSNLIKIKTQIDIYITSILDSIANSSLDMKFNQLRLEKASFQKELSVLNEFITCLNRYDLDLRFNNLKQCLLNLIETRTIKLNEIEEQLSNNNIMTIIDTTALNFLNQLKFLSGWNSVTEDLFNSKVECLKAKFDTDVLLLNESNNDVIDLLIKLIIRLESSLNDPNVNIKMRAYDLIDSTIKECTQLLSKDDIFIRKRAAEEDQDMDGTPRKSSRISSLNVQLGGINFDSTDDSINVSPTSQKYQSPPPKNVNGGSGGGGLTTRKLLASPKIHSPNRLAGLGVSYQINFKGFKNSSDDDNQYEEEERED